MHILIIGGISRSLINFRGPLIRDMLAAGHNVTACAGEPREEVAATLKAWGVDFIPVNLARAGMNPLGDLKTFLALRRIMQQRQPDAVLAYTIKPVIWGVLASRAPWHPQHVRPHHRPRLRLHERDRRRKTEDSGIQTADRRPKTEDNRRPQTED